MRILFFGVGVPAGVGPLAVAKDEDFGDAAGGHLTLAVFFGFVQILAVENCDIAEALNFGAWKFQADELSTCACSRAGDCTPKRAKNGSTLTTTRYWEEEKVSQAAGLPEVKPCLNQ